MLPRSIGSYGGPYQDEEAVVDPSSEIAAAFADRLLEDVAQLTRATGFTWVSFVTSNGAPGTLSAANVRVAGLFGAGTPQKPTVEKLGPGTYQLTWPASFEDALVGVPNLGAVEETQSVVFTFASGCNVRGINDGRARVSSLASNVAYVLVYDTANALSDLGGVATIELYLR